MTSFLAATSFLRTVFQPVFQPVFQSGVGLLDLDGVVDALRFHRAGLDTVDHRAAELDAAENPEVLCPRSFHVMELKKVQ